jgi:hypothetical protein
MKRLILTMALAVAALAPALAQAGKLSIANASDTAIAHIYISPIDVDRFGPDLLRGAKVPKGGAYVFPDLPNGLYDMKIVDETGAECLLKDVDYFQYSVWTIKPNCGAFGGTGG